MTKRFGAAAENRLAEAWDTIFSHHPANQEIIHVLTWPTELVTGLAGFAPFETWMRNGRKADDEVWHTFAEVAASWPYIHNARRALAAEIVNVRIFTLKRDGWETAPLWLQYLSEVHIPAIAALAGETLYRVWLEDSRDFGVPERVYDVNLWGAAGIMLTGYRDGDVDWREFLDGDRDADRFREERDFVVSMRGFAAARGELIKLPAALAAS
jgi:hypothetical protein